MRLSLGLCEKSSPMSVLSCQLYEEGGEGSAAVAEGEFGGDVEFGHGLVLFREIEERVVAEALGALGSG